MTRLLLTGLAVCLLLAAPARLAIADGEADAIREVLTMLDMTDSPATSVVARRLAMLGPEALPALIEVHETTPPRDHARREALGQAIETHGTDRIVDHLRHYVETQGDDNARILALRVLATFGDATTMGLAVELVVEMDPAWLRSPLVVRAWEGALGTLTADRAGRLQLLEQWDQVPDALQPAVASVLAKRGGRRDLGLLLDLIQRSEREVDRMLLALRDASPVVLAGLDLPSRLQRHLAARDPDVRTAAAAVLAGPKDPAVVPDLIRLLDDPNPKVVHVALGSLRTLTGMRFEAERAVWSEWHAEESHQLAELDLDARLQDQDATGLVAALREVARRRLVPRSTVDRVAALLGHESSGVRVLACATLGSLGRPRVAPDLVDALSDPEASVRYAAWQALRRVTGETFPADPGPWIEALASWRS